jgi:hypothetical protein
MSKISENTKNIVILSKKIKKINFFQKHFWNAKTNEVIEVVPNIY